MAVASSYDLKTLAVTRVFPQLQDKLNAFPVATIYNRMINDWPSLRPVWAPFKTPDLYRKLSQLYGAYVVAMQKGANPYQLADRNPPFKTVSFIIEQTGIDRQTVVAFLSTLESLAKRGAIDFQYWNPKRAIEQGRAVQAQQAAVKAATPKGPIEDGVSTVKTAIKWVAIIGGVAAGAYALSQVRHLVGK